MKLRARPRRRHADHGQAPRLRHATTRSASTTTDASSASRSRSPAAAATRPTCPGSINDRAMFHSDNCYYLSDVGITSYRCKTNTQSNTAFRGFGGPQGMVAHRARRRRDRPRARPRPARRAQGQLLRHDRAQRHALPPDDRRECRSPEIVDELEKTSDYRGRREAIRAWNRDEPVPQARHRADAGQVRHLVHGDAPEPGRRAGARVHRRHRAAEPRRHRDGAGPVHQGRAGRRDRARHRCRPHSRHRVGHEQGAERVGDRGLVGLRHQRQGGAGRGAGRCASGLPRSPPSTSTCP